jgi:GMP synthase (glutamine-hydrolysing)
MRLLIVQTGSALPAVRERFGDFPEWFRRGLGLTPEQIAVVRVDAGAALPPVHTVAAAVITGSGAMVTERLDWSERTATWLRDATRAGLPTLGVCYGHQLLAHALGGRVGYNPRGREIGTVEIQRLSAASDDPLFGKLPPVFSAHATHLQSVLQPPPGAVVLARSAQDDCQAVRYAPNAWGMQFHPEFGVREMRGYLHERAAALGAEGLDASAILRALRACAQARGLLRRFVRIALRGRR